MRGLNSRFSTRRRIEERPARLAPRRPLHFRTSDQKVVLTPSVKTRPRL